MVKMNFKKCAGRIFAVLPDTYWSRMAPGAPLWKKRLALEQRVREEVGAIPFCFYHQQGPT